MNVRDELICLMTAPFLARAVHAATGGEDEGSGNAGGGSGPGTGVVTDTKPKTQKPSMYKVLLLNDDYTPMEFVVHVLERFFNKSQEDATKNHAPCPPAGGGHLRRISLRDRRSRR